MRVQQHLLHATPLLRILQPLEGTAASRVAASERSTAALHAVLQRIAASDKLAADISKVVAVHAVRAATAVHATEATAAEAVAACTVTAERLAALERDSVTNSCCCIPENRFCT